MSCVQDVIANMAVIGNDDAPSIRFEVVILDKSTALCCDI